MTAFGALMDLALGLTKIFVGVVSHSSAMYADGLHSLSDVISDIVVLLSLKLSGKQPTARYAYGFKRVEALGVLFIGILLAGFAITLAIDAISLLLSPQEQPAPEKFAIYVAAGCLVLKEIYFWLSYSLGKRTGSQLLIANAQHSRTDVYTSALVLTGLFATQFAYPWFDQAMALFISGLVIWQSMQFTRNSISELLDENLPDNKRALIEKLVLAIAGIVDIHDLRARKLASDYYLECHVVVKPHLSVSEGHYLGECAEKQIRKIYPEVTQINIHIDTFCDTSDHRDRHYVSALQLPGRDEIVRCLEKLCADLPFDPNYEALRIHYHETEVELDVICPFDASLYASSSRASYERRLLQIPDHVEWLSKVNLYYQADSYNQLTESYRRGEFGISANLLEAKRPKNVVYLDQRRHHRG